MDNQKLPIGVQLYTLRDALAADFRGVIEKVAAIGYAGVETAGMFGESVQSAAQLFQDLGLTVTSAHSPAPLSDDKNQVLDTMAALGCQRLVIPAIMPDQFTSTDKIKQACEMLNQASEVARENGLSLLYHNHWWEYQAVDGRIAYQIMLEHLDPSVQFEIDTYWVKTAGQDPAAIVREMGKRAPLLHIKDGAATIEASMVAVGDGVMNWHEVIPAAQGSAEWLIVELDRSEGDMLEAVEKSFGYLTREGFGHGQ